MNIGKYIFFGLLVFLIWGCGDGASEKKELIDFVPKDPVVVITIGNASAGQSAFETFKRDLAGNNFLSAYKNTQAYRFFSEENTLLHHLKPSSQSVFCINTPTDSTTVFTFITRDSPQLFKTDSLKNISVETLSYNNLSLQRVTLNDQVAFTAVQDSVFIASSSQTVLQQILEGATEKDPTFRKIATLNSGGEVTTLIRAETVAITDSTTVNFASWTALDTQFSTDGIAATGVALARDTVPQLLSVFKGLLPRQNEIAKVIPTNAYDAVSFTYNDAELFYNNLGTFRGVTNTTAVNPLFESVNEIGVIRLADSKAIALKSIDPMLTEESLLKYMSEHSTFREETLSSFSEPSLFTDAFAPLVHTLAPKFVFQLDQFFIFSETEAAAHEIITAFHSNTVLQKSEYFERATAQLSTSSSLLIYKMNGAISPAIASFFASPESAEIASVTPKQFPFAALQFSYDRDFAHVTLVCKELSKGIENPGGITQQASAQLDHELLGAPQLFSNHRTQGNDIVVQDIRNTLYLISESGKILWTKSLEGPILGKVHEVDLLRNGKKQLAFVTKNTFHVLDRNGSAVAPFPLKFKDKITQPLAVFDYDNNRKYRFLVVQGKDVLMYDSNGKIVNGFTFKKAKTDIVLTPQHIRMGNKDYIVVAESNGTLNILSRIGKPRVTVSKKFDFSEIPIAEEDNAFVVIDKGRSKIKIDQNGNVATQNLDVSSSYSFLIDGTTKVTMDDNMLRINGKLLELPFGIYSRPEVFNANRETYVSVTETQENKVYVYTKTGKLLNGFPVFGSSIARLGNASKKGVNCLVVQGGPKEVVIYMLK
ncbi:hypothetical protein [Altibacter sp.]|uniref:hypothetical protein n=1 Tax=Altibacter sp. TaxID=2024823 RepID=UPI000C89EB78|nr:hypothetical protein [Altibacter sp.]MAP53301.1 hypothetical protein [Altibacter sp.]